LEDAQPKSLRQRPIFILYIAMFAALVWIDRLLKKFVSGHMQIGEAIPSQDAFFSIRYTINDGVSFSMFSAGNPNVLIALQSVLFVVVAVVWVVVYREGMKRFEIKSHPMLLIGLTWIVAGGAGNLIDRILYRYVIDFISVGTFPIWNFADMCIVGGCVLVGVRVLFLSGRPDASAAGEEAAADGVDGAAAENSAYLEDDAESADGADSADADGEILADGVDGADQEEAHLEDDAGSADAAVLDAAKDTLIAAIVPGCEPDPEDAPETKNGHG
jgi:signal peptidase II